MNEGASVENCSAVASSATLPSDAGKAILEVGKGVVSGAKKIGEAVSNARSSYRARHQVGHSYRYQAAKTNRLTLEKSIVAVPQGQVFPGSGRIGEVTLYCVNCGVNGNIHISGHATFIIGHGLQKLNARMHGNIAAGLQLGLNAQAEASQAFTSNIASAGAPGFSVPGIIALGPVIEVKAEVELGISPQGQVLVVVNMNIPNFFAELDLVDGSKSVSKGFTPQFQKVFEAKSKISATAALGLPVSVGLEKPTFEAMIGYTASTSCTLGPQTCSSSAPASTATRRPVFKRADPLSLVESDENTPANDSEFQALSDAALSESSHENRTTNDGELTGTPNTGYIFINDTSISYSLDAHVSTGNIYIAGIGKGTYFAEAFGIVVGDDAEHFLHYYLDVLKAYNVSRLRLSTDQFIPKTAELVAFAPVDYDNNPATPSYYAAFETVGNFFYPITCDIQNQPSTLFLAADPVQGIKTLQQTKLRYMVTGGVVTDCYYKPWIQSAPLTSS